jgi:hypothetical protein
MKHIRVACPTCGPVRPPITDVRLTVYTPIEHSYCEFWCGSCLTVVRCSLTGREVHELVDADVAMSFSAIPLEVLEPKDGEPISVADIERFAREIARLPEAVR